MVPLCRPPRPHAGPCGWDPRTRGHASQRSACMGWRDATPRLLPADPDEQAARDRSREHGPARAVTKDHPNMVVEPTCDASTWILWWLRNIKGACKTEKTILINASRCLTCQSSCPQQWEGKEKGSRSVSAPRCLCASPPAADPAPSTRLQPHRQHEGGGRSLENEWCASGVGIGNR